MGECKFCGFAKILESYEFCPNCGARLVYAKETVMDSDHVKLWGGESRIATLFFVNFINTEKTIDKSKIRQNAIYLAEAIDEFENIIKKYDGTANKIFPDNRILAAFGIPKTHRDDPERAMECIFAIRDYYQNKVAKKEFGNWRISFGVNTGWVFFGYVIEKLSYLTIIGDTVNVAARLTQICPPDEIYLSNPAYEGVSDIVEVDFIGERMVKGRTESVKIYKLKGFLKEKRKSVKSKFPLLGREKEFEKLMNCVRTVNETKTLKICAITGQMGIGKTRLKEEFIELFKQDTNYQIFESYCAVEIHTSYYPFKLFLRELLDLNEFDDSKKINDKIDKFVLSNNLTLQDAQGIRHLFITDMRRVWGEKLQKIQEEIFSAVRNVLRVICEKKPLILIFEEFNRADNLSKMLVNYLISELSDYPIFLLMVNFIDDISGRINLPLEVINLTPLSFDAVKDLIKFVLNCDVDEKLVEFIAHTSGGNPLFVIETIRNVKRSQMIRQDKEGKWYLEKERRLPFLDDLYGVVMSGIDALSSAHRLLIDYAAVIGYSFPRKIIANLLSNIPDIEQRLDYLIKEDYIIQFRDSEDPVYIFRHNLLRDAVYTTLPLKKRKEIHKRVAELLENTYANCLSEYYETLAQQFLSCEMYEKAAHYFKLSGDKAKTLYSIEPAMNYYNTVLRIEDEHPGVTDAEKIIECQLNLSDLYELKGDIQRMKTIAEQGKENTHKLNLLRWNLLFTERLAFACYLLNEFTKAEELYIGAIEICNGQMADILTILYTGLGKLYQAKNEPEKSLLNYNLAWITARNNDYKEGELPCLLNLSRMHQNLGNYELGFEYLNYALSDLVKHNEILNLAEIRYLIGENYYQVGNIENAKHNFQEAFNLTEHIGTEITLKSALNLALIESIDKNQNGVEHYLNLVDKKISLLVRDNLLAEINLKKSFILINMEQIEKAREFVNNALKLATKLNNKEIEFACYILLSDIEEEKGIDYLRNALNISETLKYPPLIGQALYKLALFYYNHKEIDQAHYYGRKALYVLDDIKARLNSENRAYFIKRKEYSSLLEF
uniref:Guanylate cyclase domain-containing protein n=1 Tax=candidate division WOR-3 bacterium TaxID=2052148 RepID=A0A7C6EI44_UNCW3